VLRRDFDPLRLAQIYRENGAAAISVLTDERYFGGCLDHLRQIAAGRPGELDLRPPLLRKDFLFDPYQVYEARAAQADAVLLIVAALPPALLRDLHGLALELGMAALVEVHTSGELETALDCQARLIGINNRDLHDFTTSLETTLRFRPLIPPGIPVVAESGIHTVEDARRLSQAGVDAILVGGALVTAEDVAGKVREFNP
jgi:indole-3-glycerol phosphate synthase